MQTLGYEFGKFRLKEHVSKDRLVAVSTAMDQYFYPEQEGFISHSLIELDGGDYMDLVVATSRKDAERICGNWQGNPYCEAFLDLIDPDSVSIGFGQEMPLSLGTAGPQGMIGKVA